MSIAGELPDSVRYIEVSIPTARLALKMINERDYLLDVNDTLRSEIRDFKLIKAGYEENKRNWEMIEGNYKNTIEGMKVPWYDHFWIGIIVTLVTGSLILIFVR